jgi:hypothetical protein
LHRSVQCGSDEMRCAEPSDLINNKELASTCYALELIQWKLTTTWFDMVGCLKMLSGVRLTAGTPIMLSRVFALCLANLCIRRAPHPVIADLQRSCHSTSACVPSSKRLAGFGNDEAASSYHERAWALADTTISLYVIFKLIGSLPEKSN